MSETLELAKALIARPSVTPNDAGCQSLLKERLATAGFNTEELRFGEVDNCWARRGAATPLLVFAGHTDVVPPGPSASWTTPPFEPSVRDGYLYGRGAADMKGGLAAMVTAAERFVARHPDHGGSIAFLFTSDEEGPSVDGTVKVVEHLRARGDRIDWCIVGEPTSEQVAGDTIKNGRRGSLNGRLLIHGKQGHVAYPDNADNPVHRLAPVLETLCATRWDEGDELFPPTTFQVSNINTGTGAVNVIPGEVELCFNLRYSTALTEAKIAARVENLLREHHLSYTLEWESSARPFITRDGVLLDAARAAVRDVTGLEASLSTAGGTSDGRFIAPTGAQVAEIGVVNKTIHGIDECVAIEDLERLSLIYEGVLERLLEPGNKGDPQE